MMRGSFVCEKRRRMFHDEVIADDRRSIGRMGKVERASRKGARGACKACREAYLYSHVFAPAFDMMVLDLRSI